MNDNLKKLNPKNSTHATQKTQLTQFKSHTKSPIDRPLIVSLVLLLNTTAAYVASLERSTYSGSVTK